MGQITTVIFDMYETLAENNSVLWVDLFGRICADQRLAVSPQVLFDSWKPLEMQFRKVRLNLNEPEKSPPFKAYEEAWRECFVGAFAELGIEGDAAAAAKASIRDMGEREAYPDALSALPRIQQRWRTGLLSNADNDYLYPILERQGWQFEAVLSSEEAQAYKPLPAPFLSVMDKMGVAPEESLYIGDSLHDDVLGCKGVGMRAAWLNRPGSPLDMDGPQPDYVISSLDQLADVLDGAR